MNTIIEGLIEYFGNCPLMADGRLNMDYLPEKGTEYALATQPTDEVVYSYVGGGARCRYPFIISSVFDYGPGEAQNVMNSGFFETLSDWLRKQSRVRNLPELPVGMTARSIRAIGPGYLYEPDVDAGKYQIQCELEYYKKGDR